MVTPNFAEVIMPRLRPALAAFALSLFSFPLLPALAQDEEEHRFQYDEAGNLLSRTTVKDGVETVESMPLDGSGRNRPASVGGVPLEWDANGNLRRKGDLDLLYDYRNLLTEVRNPQGQVLARYVYDAFNRRVEQHVGGDVVQTIWSGQRPVETYVNGTLSSRRVYGVSLDEILRLEKDLDGDGTLEQVYTPIYDSTGNLAVVTDQNGKPVERYEYSPYGRRKIYVDLTPPRIEQVRVVGGDLWLEVSETVSTEALTAALGNGALRLESGSEAIPLSLAGTLVHARRHRVTLALQAPPSPNASVTLHIEPEALVDYFLNKLSEELVATFSWPEEDAVVFDTQPPAVYEVAYRDRVLEAEFSEEIDLATATPSIQVAGYVISWTKSEDGYRLTAGAPVPDGTHDLYITETLTDLAGTALAEQFYLQLHVYPLTPYWVAFRAPDLREVPESTIANEFGFHGLPQDPVTGFLYVRNRYYDPDLARFITPDPMGFVDGPNPYQYAGNDPVNFTDPLGLYQIDVHYGMTLYLARLAGFSTVDALTIARSAQRPDEDHRDPVAAGFALRFPWLVSQEREHEAARALRGWHFPLTPAPGGPNAGNLVVIPGSREANRAALHGIASGNMRTFGEGLHVLQDSFSHQGLPPWVYQDRDHGIYARYGHPENRGGPLSTAADLPEQFPADARRAIELTFVAMVTYRAHTEGLTPEQTQFLWRAYSRSLDEIDEFIRADARGREEWLRARGIVLP